MSAPPGLDGHGVLITVPTFNEHDNLAGLVARLRRVLPAAEVLVVDDGSPDGTGALAETLAAADAHVRVLHHAPRAGLGAAYVDAFTWLLDRGAGADVGWIVQMDADGSHAPEELPRLLAVAGESDVVLGSRYVTGGDTRGWARHRRALSRAGNGYSRRLLNLPPRDVTGGFRCFRRSVLAEIGMATVASEVTASRSTWCSARCGPASGCARCRSRSSSGKTERPR